jgi:hypothetical protein
MGQEGRGKATIFPLPPLRKEPFVHLIFSNPKVKELRSNIIYRITKYHQTGGSDFGALGMVRWLKNNLTNEELDLLVLIEEEAGELEATSWLSDALQRSAQTTQTPAQA